MPCSPRIIFLVLVLGLQGAALARAQVEQQTPSAAADRSKSVEPSPKADAQDPGRSAQAGAQRPGRQPSTRESGTPDPGAPRPVAPEPTTAGAATPETAGVKPVAEGSAARPSVAEDTVTGESVVGESAAGETVAGKTVTGETAMGESVVGESAAGETVAGKTVMGDTVAGEAVADEVIMDPELDGMAPPPEVRETPSPAPGPSAPTGELRVVLRSRLATDVQWEDPREEVWEATQLGLLEATLRRSERLKFVVGLRVSHQFASLQRDTDYAEAERVELDAVPTAAYADATLLEGLYLRAGYQSIHLGRFDAFSASDFLATLDLRNGPATMPEAVEFAQPAVKVDWDPLGWLTLRAIYVPFFQPHLVSLLNTDYALVPGREMDVVGAVEGVFGPETEMADDFQRLLKEVLPRSARLRIAESGFSAFAPDPTLAHPQGALCAAAHGPAGELGLTVGSGLDRLPALRLSQTMVDFLDPEVIVDPAALLETSPIEVLYERFAVFAVDGATEVGPVQVGFEAAYVVDRTFFAAREGLVPEPEQADVAHVGLRAEYIGDTEWLLALESFLAYTLEQPSDPDREWSMLEESRYLRGAALLIGWSPAGTRWAFETAAAAYSGPSYLVAPRVELRLVSDLYLEVGALFVGGPAPTDLSSPKLALGGLYDGIDQVFVGVRWLP